MEAAIDGMVRMADGDLVMWVHPDRYRVLVEVVARNDWQRAYRAYRRQLRLGLVDPDWPAHAILSVFVGTDDLIRGEVGQVDGFAIKTQPN